MESPDRLREHIEVSGWMPVDARLHVSSVAKLARKLGGEQLYGKDPTVPLRELIQNAADAVRARRLQQGHPKDWGQITVRLGWDDQGAWVEIEDTGIGMSEGVLKGPLLDFGTSYWGSDLMREEHEGLWAKGFEPTGRFGIGFFSVFMWGHRVRVATRRYTEGTQGTRVLEFRTGLNTRPLLRVASPDEQLKDGGTNVRIWLLKDPRQGGGLLCPSKLVSLGGRLLDLGALCAWLAPSLDVDLLVEDEDGLRRVVVANDWIKMDEVSLIYRMSLGQVEAAEGDREYFARSINDHQSRPLGRMAIGGLPAGNLKLGAVTVGGLRANDLDGVVGVLMGSAIKASRDEALPLADTSAIASWASDQAGLLAGKAGNWRHGLASASWIVYYGGDPGELPVVMLGGNPLNRRSLEQWFSAPVEILMINSLRLFYHRQGLILNENVLMAYIQTRRETMVGFIRKSLAKAWRCVEVDVSISYSYDLTKVGLYEDGTPAMDSEIVIFSKNRRRPF